MRDQWNETVNDMAFELLTSFEVCATWPDYSTFKDICDDYDATPSKSLFGHCINLARIKWEAIEIETKKDIANNHAETNT